MASRRMRIKAVAKVPTIGKPRVVEAPVNYSEPSSPLLNCRSPAPSSGVADPSEEIARIGSPRPQAYPQAYSPVSNFGFPMSPSYERHNLHDDAPAKFFSLPSPGGLIAPKSPGLLRKSPSPAPSPGPPPVYNANPDSPRRPTTPGSSFNFGGENSQDALRSPVYSPSYSAMSPGYGPGIQRVHPPPSPSPVNSPVPSPGPRDFNNAINNTSLGITRLPPVPGSAGKTMLKNTQGTTPSSKPGYKDSSIISQVLNNSETLRQRLQSGSAVPSTSKYAMIRKDYLAKYQNNTPNPKDLTMLHYAFFNPPKPIEEGRKPEDGEVPKLPGTPKRRRRTESRDSVASVASSVSIKSLSPVTIAEEESPVKDPSQSVGPRVKVGPDGKLIIDEQSLIIETSEAQRAKKSLENMETVSGASFVVGSSGIYSRKKSLNRGVDWDEKETMKFYKALITCGTDFSMMATVFKGTRTRGELKAKFKREDRRNPQQVSHALAKQCFDPTLALTDSEEESEAGVLETPESDIGDIENIKTTAKRHRKEEVSQKEDFKKTKTSLKKKGGLTTNLPPKTNSIPFRRPSGQVDWRLYAVMKNNLNHEPTSEDLNSPNNNINNNNDNHSSNSSSSDNSNNYINNNIEENPVIINHSTNNNTVLGNSSSELPGEINYSETNNSISSNINSIVNSISHEVKSVSSSLASSSIITATSEILLAEH